MLLVTIIYMCMIRSFAGAELNTIEDSCGYESCPATSLDKINIHFVPHTHDDVGWLKTVDQYYYGSKSSIQKAGVQYILDSVIQELLKDPKRRFIYVESAFFFKWWNEQDKQLQEKVKELVRQGRLEFIGGAWSMNDEATTHYQSIIDQFSYGLKKINDTFGVCGRPKIGWQIDPFGHSREMASIFAQMGYDGQFFARLDYEDKNERLANKSAEMVWHGSSNLGESSDLFTGILFNHYSAPPGFCFDVLCNDEPIIDGKHSADYNVDKRLKQFFNHIEFMSRYYKTNNIMIPMGDDFTYQDANMWYKNIDKLIKYGNALQSNDSKYHLFYSTPSCYLKSLYETNITWPTKKLDFFPYSTDPHTFWSGYYTSRPTVKRYERITNHFLQVCKQLTAISYIYDENPSVMENLNYLREVMGVMQHHDAITGTEKVVVAHDYERLMYEANSMCNENTKKALRKLMNAENLRNPYEFETCHNLNISACELTEDSNKFMVTLYNPISQEIDEYIRIPVPEGDYEVTNSEGSIVTVNMMPISVPITKLLFRFSTALYELVFRAKNIPPKGYDSYFITKRISLKVPEVLLLTRKPRQLIDDSSNDNMLKTENISLTFNENGFLSSVTLNGISTQVHQEFLYYEGSVGNNLAFANRSSGAYIFRPKVNTTAHKVTHKVQTKIYKSQEVQEMHQVFNDWVSQVIRIYENESYIEFDWLIGPIPVEGLTGKEVINRFTTNINSKNIFYTDSNGREEIERIRNKRESFEPTLEEEISGNYYPVTTKISLQDENVRMSILTDRAEGGTSLESGELELMIHRRLMHDDAFGVGEALNEMAYGQGIIVRGKHYLTLGPRNSDIRQKERELQLKIHLPTWPFFSNLEESEIDQDLVYKFKSIFSESLPVNINLMTIEPWGENQILLRYENILEKADSLPALGTIINIKKEFDLLHGYELRETTLDGNQWLSEMKRFKFKTNDSVNEIEKSEEALHIMYYESNERSFDIVLYPMQIRTFILKYIPASSKTQT